MLGGGLSRIEEAGNSSLASARWWIIRDRRGRYNSSLTSSRHAMLQIN